MTGIGEFRALDGGCACGRVRYRLEMAPIVVHACHCLACQRRSGSAFAVNAMIEARHVHVISADRPVVVQTPSAMPEGKPIHRCPACHLALWSNHAALGSDIALVAVGTLDEPAALAPDVHCFTATKHPWLALPGGVPAFEGDYDPQIVWSDEAQARLKAAMPAGTGAGGRAS